MMYGGEYMKKKKGRNGDNGDNGDYDDETEKLKEYGCVGPTSTFKDILSTYKKK